MNAEQAVATVTEYVRDTGTPAAEAVRSLWEQLKPIDDPEPLIQFALAARVSVQYRRPGQEIEVWVKRQYAKAQEYRVTVELLQEVRYNVNGKVKSVAVCDREDILSLAADAQAGEEGFARYRRMWQHAAERLEILKKKHVADLPDDEKLQIATMLHDCQKFRLSADLKGLPAPG